MSLFRVLLAILFPPLAVFDRGCGSIVIVFLLTLCAWVPGVIGALIILNRPFDYEPYAKGALPPIGIRYL